MSSLTASEAPLPQIPGDLPYDDNTQTQLIVIHGLCMFLAFAVLPVVGIFAARHLQKKPYWMYLHGGIHMLLVALVVLGVWVIEQILESPFRFPSVHAGIGTILVLVAIPIQLGAGLYTAFTWDQARTRTPINVKFHRWFGRLVLLIACVQLQLGVVRAGLSADVTSALWYWLTTIISFFIIMGKRPKYHRAMPSLPRPPADSVDIES
ncbi:hypothetical protein HDU98_005311, partial [Podochytrium sp. JEL0797]